MDQKKVQHVDLKQPGEVTNEARDSTGGDMSAEPTKRRGYNAWWQRQTVELIDSLLMQFIMTIALIVALFAVDVVAAVSAPDSVDRDVNIVLIIILVMFALEVVANVLCREHYGKLFLAMDVLGTVSIIFDITWFTKGWMEQDDQNTARASMAVRVGSKAGRMTRLVRVVKLLRVFKMFNFFSRLLGKEQPVKQKNKENMAPTAMGQNLAESISHQVALLVMATVICVPLLTYEEVDLSPEAYAKMFSIAYGNGASYEELNQNAVEMYEFFESNERVGSPIELTIGPYVWDWSSENGGYSDRASDKMTYNEDEVRIGMDVQLKNQETALLNILMVIFVILELILSIVLLNGLTTSKVVQPLERIFNTIKTNATMIMGALELDEEEAEDEMNSVELAVKKMTKLVQHVAPSGSQGNHVVQAFMKDKNVDESTRAWLAEMQEGPKGDTRDSQKSDLGVRRSSQSTDQLSRFTAAGHTVAPLMTPTLDEPAETGFVVRNGKKLDVNMLNSWEFNVFNYSRDDLYEYCMLMFEELGLFECQLVDPYILRNYLREVASLYHDNAYHNFEHCIDVTHAVYRFITLTEHRTLLTSTEKFALMVAATAHDMDHPGVNNMYLVNTRDLLARTYNDSSVLENRHVSCLYQLIQEKPEADIFSNVPDEKTWREIRKIIIYCILHTDMVHHFKMVSQLEVFFELHSADVYDPKLYEAPEDRLLMLSLMLHASDISNPMKPWHIYEGWASCVLAEFFSQGDKERERKLPISAQMDRDNTSKPMSQIGFMEFIVAPLYGTTAKLFPEMAHLMLNLLENRRRWGELYSVELDSSSKSVDDKAEEKQKLGNRLDTFADKYTPDGSPEEQHIPIRYAHREARSSDGVPTERVTPGNARRFSLFE
mmetsp:Transcript_17174/g.56226  ORF Transcript_17174/g.56226 Transcript_17174/m.56226 type:complete len:887 (+) Transcript_17174:482-3142(+)